MSMISTAMLWSLGNLSCWTWGWYVRVWVVSLGHLLFVTLDTPTFIGCVCANKVLGEDYGEVALIHKLWFGIKLAIKYAHELHFVVCCTDVT